MPQNVCFTRLQDGITFSAVLSILWYHHKNNITTDTPITPHLHMHRFITDYNSRIHLQRKFTVNVHIFQLVSLFIMYDTVSMTSPIPLCNDNKTIKFYKKLKNKI